MSYALYSFCTLILLLAVGYCTQYIATKNDYFKTDSFKNENGEGFNSNIIDEYCQLATNWELTGWDYAASRLKYCEADPQTLRSKRSKFENGLKNGIKKFITTLLEYDRKQDELRASYQEMVQEKIDAAKAKEEAAKKANEKSERKSQICLKRSFWPSRSA